ncbi:MAG: hypothetical protein IJC11_00500 [Alphaproteobacteria bacterium]|nr:hypothetical protein [Alphaproteobacteria bacterium]
MSDVIFHTALPKENIFLEDECLRFSFKNGLEIIINQEKTLDYAYQVDLNGKIIDISFRSSDNPQLRYVEQTDTYILQTQTAIITVQHLKNLTQSLPDSFITGLDERMHFIA